MSLLECHTLSNGQSQQAWTVSGYFLNRSELHIQQEENQRLLHMHITSLRRDHVQVKAGVPNLLQKRHSQTLLLEDG